MKLHGGKENLAWISSDSQNLIQFFHLFPYSNLAQKKFLAKDLVTCI